MQIVGAQTWAVCGR